MDNIIISKNQKHYDKTIFCPLLINLLKYFPVYSADFSKLIYFGKERDFNYKNRGLINETLNNMPIMKGDIVSLHGFKYTKKTVIEDIYIDEYYGDTFTVSAILFAVNSGKRSIYHLERFWFAQWFPTDIILKKKIVLNELIKYVHMKKITNFVINYKIGFYVKW